MKTMQIQISKKITKKAQVLSIPDVKRWYDNLKRRSINTAETRIRRLNQFCKENNTTPMKLIEIGQNNTKKITDILQDHVTFMEKKKNAPGYIHSTITSIKSWLAFFDIVITRKILISDSEFTPTLQNERVPNKQEIQEVFLGASLRTGCVMSLIAKAGIRLQVIGNADATDGLMLKDFPELSISNSNIRFKKTPARVFIRKSISKNNKSYFTFLTEMTQRWIISYLKYRRANNERLTRNSPLIQGNTNKKFFRTARISSIIRQQFRPRFLWRPYILRSYFRTQMLIAESQGKVARDFIVFWFGHSGDMSARYSTNKGILPENLLAAMEESFLKCNDYLDLELQKENHNNKRKRNKLKQFVEKMDSEKIDEMIKICQR
jgi:hypothetical protein